MDPDPRKRKLLWLVFCKTVSVLVENSRERWGRENIVNGTDQVGDSRKGSPGMEELVFYRGWGALF